MAQRRCCCLRGRLPSDIVDTRYTDQINPDAASAVVYSTHDVAVRAASVLSRVTPRSDQF